MKTLLFMPSVAVTSILTVFCLLKAAVIAADSNEISDRWNDQYIESVLGTKITVKPGRHVCTTEKIVSRPVQIAQTYKQPIYITHPRECSDFNNCPQFDVSYVTKNRTVFKLEKSSSFRHSCCPGWTQGQRRDKGCMAPICTNGCGDFGICAQPEVCQCRSGFTGEMCDTDIDECRQDSHDCQHICKNTAGSYICACQTGFTLAADGKTCTYCYTCQEEYTSLVSAVEDMKSKLVDMSFQKDHLLLMTAQNESTDDKIRALDEKVEELTAQNVKQTVLINNLNDTYEGNANLREEVLRHLAECEEQMKLVNIRDDSLKEIVKDLEQEIRDLTEQNLQLKSSLSDVYEKLNETFHEIKLLKDVTRKSLSTPATHSLLTSSMSTASTQPSTQPTTSTQPPTTQSKKKPSNGLEFSIEDVLYSLSDQIGMMEEKLELCQCVARERPYK